MADELTPQTDPDQLTIYRIRIRGHLGQRWADWFGGLTITLEDTGETLLTGPVVDQAALHGLLRKVRDLGLPLVSVGPVPPIRQTPQRSTSNRRLAARGLSFPQRGRVNRQSHEEDCT